MKASWIDLSLLKQPSAWIPMVMALAGLSLIIGHVAVFGLVQEEDEGAAAHIWQLLMLAQLPFMAYFLLKWLPRRVSGALQAILVLGGLWIANFVLLFWMESTAARLAGQ